MSEVKNNLVPLLSPMNNTPKSEMDKNSDFFHKIKALEVLCHKRRKKFKAGQTNPYNLVIKNSTSFSEESGVKPNSLPETL